MTAADPDRMLALLARIEELENRRGWDRWPVLFALYDVAAEPGARRHWRRADSQSAGPQVEHSGYLAVVYLGRRSWPDGRPPIALRLLAAGVTANHRGIGRAVVDVLGTPGLAGLAFMQESWSLRGGRSLADTPGAIEARDVVAVDGADRTYAVHRRRGHPPVSTWTEPDAPGPDGRKAMDGYAHDSLRALVSALFGRPRPDLLESRPVDTAAGCNRPR